MSGRYRQARFGTDHRDHGMDDGCIASLAFHVETHSRTCWQFPGSCCPLCASEGGDAKICPFLAYSGILPKATNVIPKWGT